MLNALAVVPPQIESEYALPERCSASGAVGAVLSQPGEHLDYARAKLAFDRMVDPSIDEEAVLAELDRMVEAARHLADPDASENANLAALRKLIYEDGPWNRHQPYAYDHADPCGQGMCNMLLATYLATRRGNCVSMPILFLILADKLGLNVALAAAPDHLFVRHTDRSGRVANLETTSGANPARLE